MLTLHTMYLYVPTKVATSHSARNFLHCSRSDVFKVNYHHSSDRYFCRNVWRSTLSRGEGKEEPVEESPAEDGLTEEEQAKEEQAEVTSGKVDKPEANQLWLTQMKLNSVQFWSSE